MKLLIPSNIYAEIDYYVQKCPIEISWLGRLKKDDEGNFVLTKIYLLKQENTGVSTEIDADAVATLLYQTRKDEGMLNWWGHSHVDMDVRWSGTDMDTKQEHGKNGFLVSTVFNKKGRYRTSYYQGNSEFLPPVFQDDIETEVAYVPTTEEVARWEAEYKAKCEVKKPKMPKGKGKGKRGKRGKSNTILGADSIHRDPQEFETWRESIAALLDRPYTTITDEMTYKYIQSYKGDFEKFEETLIQELSLREMEEDEMFDEHPLAWRTL